MNQTVRVGQMIPDVLHNSPVVPIDSQVQLNYSDFYRHEYPMVWRHARAKGLMDSYYLSSPLRLTQLPTKDDEFELPPMSEAEWKWRIRDSALSAAERSGIGFSVVEEMCAQFGAAEPKLHVGQVVSNGHDIAKLPTGTVVYSAHPDAIDVFRVWVVNNGMLTPMLGTPEGRPHGYPVVIHSIPEEQATLPLVPWPEKPATLEELAAISMRAWRVGKVFKHRQSWCGVFETTLTALGIDDKTAELVKENVYGPGDVLDREHARMLPEGSLLWHVWRNRHAAAVYIRDDGARTKSRTRRVWGFNDDSENSHDVMTVVQTPDQEMVWRVNGGVLTRMPNGVVFVKDEVTTVLDDTERYNLHTWLQYTIRSFPVVAA